MSTKNGTRVYKKPHLKNAPPGLLRTIRHVDVYSLVGNDNLALIYMEAIWPQMNRTNINKTSLLRRKRA